MVGKTKSTIRQNKKYNLRGGEFPFGQSDKMAISLSSRNKERGVPWWWHSSLVCCRVGCLLGDYLQLVAEVVQIALDGRQLGCLYSRFKASDSVDGAEHPVLSYSIFAQSLLLTEQTSLPLYLLCGHLVVV